MPHTLALLPLGAASVSAGTFALSVAVTCAGLHLGTAEKKQINWNDWHGASRFGMQV